MRSMGWPALAISLCMGRAHCMMDLQPQDLKEAPWMEELIKGNVKRGSSRSSVLFDLKGGKSQEVSVETIRNSISQLQNIPHVEEVPGVVGDLARFLKRKHIDAMANFNPDEFDWKSAKASLERLCEEKKISPENFGEQLEILKKKRDLQKSLKDFIASNTSGQSANDVWKNIVTRRRSLIDNYVASLQAGDSKKIAEAADRLKYHNRDDCDACHLCDKCLTKCLVS